MSEVTVGSNLYQEPPEHGTVLAVVTQSDVAQLKGIIDRIEAFSVTSAGAAYVNEAQGLIEERRDWWMRICRENKIPYSWPIALDWPSNAIYLDSKK